MTLNMSQKLQSKQHIDIYNYDNLFRRMLKQLMRELSQENHNLVQKYDQVMVVSSLSKATRLKHLKMLLSLTRMLKKDWTQAEKSDIEVLIYEIMKRYGSESGQETETTRDHKKVLKIFFRWMKLGSREKEEVGDPTETKWIKLKKPKDKIVREDLLTEEEIEYKRRTYTPRRFQNEVLGQWFKGARKPIIEAEMRFLFSPKISVCQMSKNLRNHYFSNNISGII